MYDADRKFEKFSASTLFANLRPEFLTDNPKGTGLCSFEKFNQNKNAFLFKFEPKINSKKFNSKEAEDMSEMFSNILFSDIIFLNNKWEKIYGKDLDEFDDSL